VPEAVLPTPMDHFRAWFGRLGLSGRLAFFGGLVGLIAVWMPALTVKVAGFTDSYVVFTHWTGKLAFMAYVAALTCAHLLYQPRPLDQQRVVVWSFLGGSGLAVLLALGLFVHVATVGDSSLSSSIHVGIGCYLNVICSLAVASGALLKARDEGLLMKYGLLPAPQQRRAAR
jgi:hypothetical protein